MSNVIELQYFEKLSDRKQKWIEDILRDPSGQNLLDSGVDKYSDQAHFIYELLQNADDTGATKATFNLKYEQLEFSHNGTRHFGISDPDTEIEDKKNGTIGDINSIVSYGQSGKKESKEVKIGKFGAGFKSVFQYTTVPEIYDRDFCFRIEKQYIPILINDKDPRLFKDETLFILPFEKPDKAHEDISFKLESLKLPLLFLNHLQTIVCKYNGVEVVYSKHIDKTIKYDESFAQLISMNCNDKTEKLWLFTKELDNKLQCSVGFFIDNNGYLIPRQYDAFCYFPTKEHTGLKFIVHAPFLLTESRENIKADEKHNQNMIDELSSLTVDSLLHIRDYGLQNDKQLINDDVYMNLFPLNQSDFTEIGDRDKLSFMPFYNSIIDMIGYEEILPCTNDVSYVSVDDAYWGRTPKIYETFDDEKLQVLTDNQYAKWIFKKEHNFNSIEQNRKEFSRYMENALSNKDNYINDSFIMNNDNLEELITLDDISWLHKFYEFAGVNEANKKLAKRKSIFIDEKGNVCSLFNDRGEELLFLPSSINTLPTINHLLLENSNTKSFVLGLGITEPSKIDQARDGILNKYNSNSYNDAKDFNLLFNLYMKLDRYEANQLVEIIKKSNYRISCTNANDDLIGFDYPRNLYFKNEQLEKYFKKTNKKVFINPDLILERQQEEFLKEIGVNKNLQIKERNIDLDKAYSISKTWTKHQNPVWTEKYIDGCSEFLSSITANKSVEDSVILWEQLKKLIESKNNNNLQSVLRGKYEYLTSNGLNFDCEYPSTNIQQLQDSKWLFDKKGNLVNPKTISFDLLNACYDITSIQAKMLIKSLGIKDAKFTNEEAEQMKFGQYVLENGLTYEDLTEMVQEKKRKEERAKTKENIGDVDRDNNLEDTNQENKQNLYKDNERYKEPEETTSFVDISPSDNPSKSLEKLEKENKVIQEKKKIVEANDFDSDEDDFIKYTQKTEEKINKKQLEIENEINEIKREQELTELIANSEKYSYKWLMALLRKELLLTGNQEEERKDLVAKFSKVEKEEGSERTILLKNPIGRIPTSIEEISDVPMDFKFGDGNPVKVIAEAFSIHSYTVKVKLKDPTQLNNFDLKDVREIDITFRQPSFLLEELINRFSEMNFTDDYNFQMKLTPNIDFVFGPPGTGKTTYLSNKVLIPKMESGSDDYKVIVLAPTNKAADVIVNRIIENKKDDKSYEEWLIRFGTTADEKIDVLPVYKDKHVEIGNYNKCVVVTTIHRFWYDFMIGDKGSTYLKDIDWDYIVIDEASMIPLAHILYPLYSQTPDRFIIAGDPFQIQPVITSEEWKDENIYTMVNLNEFTENPNTIPFKYDIKLLMTQYRSVPDVGQVFSELTYGGKLKHNRSREDQKKIEFGDMHFGTLNLIEFPVDQYESIYASKRLNRSSTYHAYSALFTYEFVKYLQDVVTKNNDDEISIGIISPYRSQADIIEKLSRTLPENKQIKLNIGTIHGFQGDECDIIICVMNTPPGGLSGKNLFVNNKNIINVAISRARDYLFVVAPNQDTRGYENLNILNKLNKIMKNRYGYTVNDSHNLEDIIFNNPNYLEENSFSTSHQNVNIYDLPEKKYEIRAEEFAVDIQIHANAIKDSSQNNNVKKVETKINVKEKEVVKEQEPIKKEETKKVAINPKIVTSIIEEDFDPSVYSMDFKLKRDAKIIFSDESKFEFIDLKPSPVFVINLSKEKYFELKNLKDEEMVSILIEAKYLNSINIVDGVEYRYRKDLEIFELMVTYRLLKQTLKELATIQKTEEISDEEMCAKLNIKYN